MIITDKIYILYTIRYNFRSQKESFVSSLWRDKMEIHARGILHRRGPEI